MKCEVNLRKSGSGIGLSSPQQKLLPTAGKKFLLVFAAVKDRISAQKPKWAGTGDLDK